MGSFSENETIVFENETKNDRLTIVYKKRLTTLSMTLGCKDIGILKS